MSRPDRDLLELDPLEPIRFGYLEKFELSQSVDPENYSGSTLILQLRSSDAADSSCHRLEFRQVRGLHLGPTDGLAWYCVEIRSIIKMWLEGMHFYVAESEHHAFSFCCRSFSVTLEAPDISMG